MSVAFIALLKITAVWFPPERFATLNGVTMFAGNLGAVIAGAPLAWVVTQTSWRVVFVALAALSAALAAVTWWRVRDRPDALAFAPVVAAAAAGTNGTPWTHALAGVLRNGATWPGFFVNIGIGGSFLAFAGLWAVPFLEQTRGMSRVTASFHASLLLLGVAFGALIVGVVSDRLSNRRGVMRVYAFAYALSWLPWLLHARLAAAGDAGVVLPDGLADSRLHADVDDREGGQSSRAFGHRDGGRQRRHLSRGRGAAAGRGRDARSGARIPAT